MTQSLPPVIAIDGPSASGKGTIAHHVAQELSFHCLDSGALYRAVAWATLREQENIENTSRVSNIALNINILFNGNSVFVGGTDVTDAIREEAIGAAASRVASLPEVRQALLARQRAFRRPPGLVAEGRDMGSVVFPDAALKIFLIATPEARARRRYKQLMEKGMSASMTALLQDILNRDARDTARVVAPLRKCADAIEIDTTAMTVPEVVEQVLVRYRQVFRSP